MASKSETTDVAVAIVGMGAVFPGAGDVKSFWRNICEGVDAISDVPPSRWDPAVYYDPESFAGPATADRFYCRRGGFVDDLVTFDPTAYGIMPAALSGAEPDQMLALRTAAEAIADAGGEGRLPDRERIGVIVGRGGYLSPASMRMDARVRTSHQIAAVVQDLVPGIQDSDLEALRAAFCEQLGTISPEASIGLVPNIAASRVANRFDFRGPAYTVDAACASSLLAVDHAIRELTSGRCDAVFAGGVHHCHIATLWSVFIQLRALSPTQQIRPFDARADGTLLAEGTGMVLLKRLRDAEREGDRIYAVIRGSGVSSDGRATSLMSPHGPSQVLALERAWREAGLDPTQPGALGLLEAHGTATRAGDQVELETLAAAFGPPGGEPAGLGTVKSMIGHTMPAAGIAALIKAALSIYHGLKPPTLHLEEPHPAFRHTRFRPVTELEPWEGTFSPRRAAVNAFGFGGINAHVILEEAPRSSAVVPVLPRTQERLLLLSAPTREELEQQLAAPDETLIAEANSLPVGEGPFRLAIAGLDERKLALARKVVARGTPWRGRSDVWYSSAPLLASSGKVAFLFPGLEPDFDPQVDDIAAHFGFPAPALHDSDGLVERSLDIIAVGRLLADALNEVGLHPDVMAGHSIGEWTAQVASGMYERELVDEFVASLSPEVLRVPEVVYAAVGCGADKVLEALDDIEGVALSHDNCPHQSVICGYSAAVNSVLARLQKQGVLSQPMPFRSGFHSPMFEPHLEPVREAFKRLPLSRPTVPVWSATSLTQYPDQPDAVRELVVRHLLEPVRFGPLVQKLHQEGVRAFVQVGVGSLLGFVDDTLRNRDYLAVSANVAGRSGMAQLRRTAAALWVEGAAISWERLGASTLSGGTRRPNTSVKLDLGNPLVRVAGDVRPLPLGSGPRGDGHPPALPLPTGDAHPIMAELSAALHEAAVTAETVVAAWQSTSVRERANGGGARLGATKIETRTKRVFSLETLPYVRDHCLIPQPPDWREDSDRFPVVPLTSLLEIMADTARDLVPGRKVVEFEQVRAFRWLEAAPETTAEVRAAVEEHGVRVSIEGYTTGLVVLADAYPEAVELPDAPLTRERPPKVSAHQLYDEGWMFHGPQFAGVRRITAFADDGIRGVLESLPTPGALLDSAGQLIGHWMEVGVDRDKMVFPVAINRIRLYGPQPEPGTPLSCTAWLRSVTDSGIRADAILRTPDGATWARIDGWTTRRFVTDDLSWQVKFLPSKVGLGEPQPGGWCLVREHCPDSAVRNLMMRRYLNARERMEFEQQSGRAQAPWLLGRIAAKDAVRNLLWERGYGALYPAEITVANDSAGRPIVEGPFEGSLEVSLSHTPSLAVAMASPHGPVGIDIEVIAERPESTNGLVLTSGERALIDPEQDRATAFTRLSAAKEAAAKAAGTGLLGQPRRFEVTGLAGECVEVVAGGAAVDVYTTLIKEGEQSYVVAWTKGRSRER